MYLMEGLGGHVFFRKTSRFHDIYSKVKEEDFLDQSFETLWNNLK